MTFPGRQTVAGMVLSALLVGGCASAPDLDDASDPATVYRIHLSDHHRVNGLPDLTDNSTLSDYLTYAALNNPGLQAAFHRWQAAVERIPQVTALPEPMVTFRVFALAMNTRAAVGIEQMFPGGRKLRLKGDAAFEASEAERERFEAQRVALVNAVKQAYFEYYYISRSISVMRDNRDLTRYFQDVATARYRVAQTQLADIVRGQVELGKAEDSLRSIEALRAPSAAKMNAALGRPAAAALPFPTTLPIENVTIVEEDILARIAVENPDLKSMGHDVAEQKAMQAAAKEEGRPDYTLGLEYMVPTSDGEHELALMLGITLPVRTEKYRAMYREALLRERAAAAAKDDKFNMLCADAKLAVYGIQDAERKIILYRDTLIPSVKESIKTSETAYSAGKAVFLDLIDSQRTLLEFTLNYERAVADHAQKIAELEMIIGGDLPRGPDVPTRPVPTETDSLDPAPAAENKENTPAPSEGGAGEPSTNNRR